jgi:hypothetical protein
MRRAVVNSDKISETHHAPTRNQGLLGGPKCMQSQNKPASPQKREPIAEDAHSSVATAL